MDFAKKRKVDSECRAFNKDWMPKYFFTEVGNETSTTDVSLTSTDIEVHYVKFIKYCFWSLCFKFKV